MRPVHRCIAVLFSAALLLATSGSAAPPPDWAADAVWYQIFPERFCNGDPANDPARESLELPLRPSAKWRVSRWTADWFARDDWEREIGPDFYRNGVSERRYGGDLQGVLDRIDYLAGLGINAIYLNPVFQARSLHKYDGSTFHHIDPNFGPDPKGDLALVARETTDPHTWQWTAADRLFLKLVNAAHARGIHVIIDGVFNHTGRDFFAFKDLRENQQRSRFRDWYAVEQFDDPATPADEFRYRGWSGHARLPEFARTPDHQDLQPGPKAYIFDATRRWMDPHGDGNPRDGIDGWRLDVASELPVKFWADWNAHVRRINPAAYTTAEVWNEPAQLIRDGGFSAAMNYHGFATPVKGFLIDKKTPPTRFARLIDERRAALPPGVAAAMQNLTASHDTERLASAIVNRARAHYDGSGPIPFNTDNSAASSPGYEVRKPDERERGIQKLTVLFQMTAVGAPMIYYGDEAGMWGAKDPDCRMPMVWPDLKFDPQTLDPRGQPRTPDDMNFDPALFAFYKSAIALRRQHPALRRGECVFVGAFDEAQSLAFIRRTGTERLLIVLNRSSDPQTLRIPLPAADLAAFRKVLFSTADGVKLDAGTDALRVALPALTGVVIGSG